MYFNAMRPPVSARYTSRYVETLDTTTSVAGQYRRVFSVNNWYDLDYTGLGHQPAYFDFFASLYTRYISQSATLTVTAVNVTTSPQTLVLHPLPGSTSQVLTVDQAIESARSVHVIIPPSGSDNTKKISLNVPFSWLYSRTDSSSPISVLLGIRAPTTNDHPYEMGYQISLFDTTGQSISLAIKLSIEIVVNGMFTDLVDKPSQVSYGKYNPGRPHTKH